MATKRRVFYSFHFERDHWRAGQVRNVGVLEGNRPALDNDWEATKRDGDVAIKRWIDSQLKGSSCAVVLIGEQTATREWIKYEIKKAWDLGKGVVGIYIHNLKDQKRNHSSKGANPFRYITIDGKSLSTIVKDHDPPFDTSRLVYRHIESNIAGWLEEAIRIRDNQ